MDLFPLTCDQLAVARYAATAPAKMFNLAVQIEIEDKIDEAMFRKAVEVTIERLPYSRGRLHKMPDGATEQYISEMGEQEIPEWLDCQKWSDKKLNKQLSKWASKPFPNKLLDVQLYRVRLLRLKDGKHGLFLCMQHIITDITAVVFFATYIDKVYYALSTNTALPRIGGDPKKVTMDRIRYFESEKYKNDNEWWQKEISTEPNFTTLNGVGAREIIKGKRYGRQRNVLQLRSGEKVHTLPRKLEELINQGCLQGNYSPSMAYTLALRTYLAAVCQTEEASLHLTVSYRTTLEQKSCGSTRAIVVAFNAKIPFEMTFEDALKEMNRADREYLKHMEMPSSYLLKEKYGRKDNEIYQSIMFSYVAFVDYDKIHLNIKARKIDSGISLRPAYILAMPMGRNEPISLVYQYAKGYYKEETIDKCHAFLEAFLENGFTHPEKTIQELVNECLHL